MRLLFRLILLLIIVTPVAVAVAAWFALSDQPYVVTHSNLSHKDIARAREILRKNDPRKLRPGATRGMVLTEQDLNLAARYLLQTYADGGARIILSKDTLLTQATARLPAIPARPYLNFSFSISDKGEGPLIHALRVGRLPVPDRVTGWLVKAGSAWWLPAPDLDVARGAVKRLIVNAQRVVVVYRWQPELLDAVRDSLLPAKERETFSAYHRRIADLMETKVRPSASLSELLPHLFAYAAERSRDSSAVAENRTLLLVLGAWSSDRGMKAFVANPSKRLHRFRLTLDRRTDFAKHFLVSAALAVGGDGLLADAVGIFKEVSDTNGGSGFSFTDLAADRAGTRFGERAVASEQFARNLQQRIAAGIAESDVSPKLRDLPEHLSESVFQRRYGEVGSAAYTLVMDEIEQRLDSVPLLGRLDQR